MQYTLTATRAQQLLPPEVELADLASTTEKCPHPLAFVSEKNCAALHRAGDDEFVLSGVGESVEEHYARAHQAKTPAPATA